MNYFKMWFIVLGLCCAIEMVLAQVDPQIQKYRNEPQGNVQNRKKGVMNGNRISTIFLNDGEVGYWPDAPSAEWPKRSGHNYLDGSALLIAAKVVAPGNGQTITPLISAYRECYSNDPITGEQWVLQPVPGYTSTQSITPAMSIDPSSWPSTWPDALNLPADWNGQWYSYFGKGVQQGLTETFFVMDDSKVKKWTRAPYNYYPITGDSSRTGLGLRVEVRGLQWADSLVEDILFWQYNIINISDYNYDTSCVGFYIDPGVGGTNTPGNSGDANRQLNMVYSWCPTCGLGTPSATNYKAGYIGFALLSTPQNVGLTALTIHMLDNSHGPTGLWIRNDAVMWSAMNNGFRDTIVQNSNLQVVVGSGPFAWEKWSTKNVSSAIVFGTDYDDLCYKALIAQALHDNNYNLKNLSVNDFSIQFPTDQSTLSGTVQIQWTPPSGLSNKAVYISSSSDGGATWSLFATDTSGTGNFSWNTTLFKDGILNKVRMYYVSSTGILKSETPGFFTINNPGNAQPQILLTAPMTGQTLKDSIEVKWIAGDADGDKISINLYYRQLDSIHWIPIALGLTDKQSYLWDTRPLPNGFPIAIRGDVVSLSDTTTVLIDSCYVQNPRITYTDTLHIAPRKNRGTGSIEIHVADPSSVTNDTYAVEFVSTDIFSTSSYNVYDLTKRTKVVSLAPATDENEGPFFDGVRLVIKNDQSISIDSSTGWISGNNTVVMRTLYEPLSQNGKRWPADYEIRFFDSIVDTALLNVPPLYPKMPVNFTTTNITDNYRTKFVVVDNDASNSLTVGDRIIIIEDYINSHNFLWAWSDTLSAPLSKTLVMPHGGDVYQITTTKPFVTGDSILFSVGTTLSAVKGEKLQTNVFRLEDNFPNPFNPSTTITFSLPASSWTVLKVYDLLGREVAIPLQQYLYAGAHSVTFNARNLPSGCYFYTLTSGNYRMNKKMLLLK